MRPRCGKLPQVTVAALALALAIALAIAPVIAPSAARADLDVPPAQLAHQLETGWRALHPREAPPARCKHPDPIRAVTADLDESPGVETAIASLRFGVVLFAADGKPLASLKLECGTARSDPTWGGVPEVLALSSLRASGVAPNDLVVRRREISHCGRQDHFTLLGRRRRALEVLLTVEEDYAGYCGGAPPSKRHAAVEVIAPGTLRIVGDAEARVVKLDADGKFR